MTTLSPQDLELDGVIKINMQCRNCHADLTIEELHYYDRGDGTATCNKCEGEWCASIEDWRHGGELANRKGE